MRFGNSVLILVVLYAQIIINKSQQQKIGLRGKTRLADVWALNGEYKIPLPLNDQGQSIGEGGGTFDRWLGSFCENDLLYLLGGQALLKNLNKIVGLRLR